MVAVSPIYEGDLGELGCLIWSITFDLGRKPLCGDCLY